MWLRLFVVCGTEKKFSRREEGPKWGGEGRLAIHVYLNAAIIYSKTNTYHTALVQIAVPRHYCCDWYPQLMRSPPANQVAVGHVPPLRAYCWFGSLFRRLVLGLLLIRVLLVLRLVVVLLLVVLLLVG